MSSLGHYKLAQRLKLDIWLADPHAPWQRGRNENTNGLLRQFLSKGTALTTLSQTALNDIARLLNGRPRQTLGSKTPEEIMSEVLALHAQNVALDCWDRPSFHSSKTLLLESVLIIGCHSAASRMNCAILATFGHDTRLDLLGRLPVQRKAGPATEQPSDIVECHLWLMGGQIGAIEQQLAQVG